MEADQKMYLCDDILHKVDIASMAVSLECRAPLLDFRLAELINPINHDLKLQNNTTKYILRKLASDRIPAEIVTLPKKGFSIPLNEWLRSDLNKWAESIIFDGYPIWENYLRRKPVERLWKEHQSGKYDHSARIWQIIAFNLAFSA
jgi:asparagine synthase (glutamine-hydrolysing)